MDHPGGEGGYDRVVLFPQCSSPDAPRDLIK